MHIQTDTHSEKEQAKLLQPVDRMDFGAVYLQYAKPMLNSSMRILNHLPDAEDMVQEAFADAFQKIESYQNKSSFEAWLKRIVINKSIDLLRKRKQIWIDISSVPLADEPDLEVTDEEAFQFEVQRVKKAVRNLPDNYRLIFNLYAVDNIPQEEIGNLLGMSHNNVRIQYHRAKKKILEILKKELEDEKR